MKDYIVYERITTVYGDVQDECIEVIAAKTEQSAINKAYARNKVKGGSVVPPYRRNKENFWARPLW